MRNKQKYKVESWKLKLSILLEVLILGSGFYQLLFGEQAIGFMILVSMVFILFPRFTTRGFISKIPIEIELILFTMVFLQLVIGEVRDFYTNVPYYDKIVHFLLPLFIGYIAFLLFYTMQKTGNLKASRLVTVILVTLISLGIGAFWEIMEYSSDRFLYPRFEDFHHFQGNAQQAAIDDTMTDLMVDTLGGVFGAILALRFADKSVLNKNERIDEITEDLSAIYKRKKKKPKK